MFGIHCRRRHTHPHHDSAQNHRCSNNLHDSRQHRQHLQHPPHSQHDHHPHHPRQSQHPQPSPLQQRTQRPLHSQLLRGLVTHSRDSRKTLAQRPQHHHHSLKLSRREAAVIGLSIPPSAVTAFPAIDVAVAAAATAPEPPSGASFSRATRRLTEGSPSATGGDIGLVTIIMAGAVKPGCRSDASSPRSCASAAATTALSLCRGPRCLLRRAPVSSLSVPHPQRPLGQKEHAVGHSGPGKCHEVAIGHAKALRQLHCGSNLHWVQRAYS
jgi:hypothetical protein